METVAVPDSALFPRIVLPVVDLARRLALLLIYGPLVGLGQLAAIGLAHSADFLIYPLFLIFEMRAFTRFQLAALDSLRNAVLLILAALANFVVAVMCRIGVVFICIDFV